MPRFMEDARTAHFIMVKPTVVRAVAGANNALVYIRMAWRCEQETRGHTIDDDRGRVWWMAKHGTIAAETGLSIEQVRYSLKQLREAGWIESWDQGKGLPAFYAPTGHLPTPSEDSDTPSGNSDSSQLEVSGISDSDLLIETVASGGRDLETQLTFETAWKHWHRKEKKKPALDKFNRIPAAHQQAVLEAVVAHGDAYHEGGHGEFTPHLVTWLNQRRWTEALPQPRRVSGQQVRMDEDLALLRRLRQDEQSGGGPRAIAG